MVKGAFILYSAFIRSALHRLCITSTHSHTHSYNDGGGNHARHQPAHWEQLGVQSLAQGLFDTNSGGARDRNGNPSGNPPCSKTFSLPLSHCRPSSVPKQRNGKLSRHGTTQLVPQWDASRFLFTHMMTSSLPDQTNDIPASYHSVLRPSLQQRWLTGCGHSTHSVCMFHWTLPLTLWMPRF